MDLFCEICSRLFQAPIKLQCGHRQCRSCFDQSTTETITCVSCGITSHRVQASEDLEMAIRLAMLLTTCLQCDWSGSCGTYQEHARQMHPSFTEHLYQNGIQCPLHEYGCTAKYSSSEREQHDSSEQHMASAVLRMRSCCEMIENMNVNFGITAPIDNAEFKKLQNLVHQLYQTICRRGQPKQPFNAQLSTSDGSSQTASSSNDEGGRQTMTNADQASDHQPSVASLRAQRLANESSKEKIASRMRYLPYARKSVKDVKSEQNPVKYDNEHTYTVDKQALEGLIARSVPITREFKLPTSPDQVLDISLQRLDGSPKDHLFWCAQLRDVNKGPFCGSIEVKMVDQSATGQTRHIITTSTVNLNSADSCPLSVQPISVDELRAPGNKLIENGLMHVSIAVVHSNGENLIASPVTDQH